MIRINYEKVHSVESGETKREIHGACNYADKSELPTEDIINGSYMFIVDRQTVSFFDEETSSWG